MPLTQIIIYGCWDGILTPQQIHGTRVGELELKCPRGFWGLCPKMEPELYFVLIRKYETKLLETLNSFKVYLTCS